MGDRVDMAEFDQSIPQEPERPAAPPCRRAPAGQGDEVGFLLAIEHSRPARYGMTNEGTIEPTFDEGAANPMDGDRPEVQGIADLLVGPRRAKVAAIGLQEDARPGQLACRPLTFGDE